MAEEPRPPAGAAPDPSGDIFRALFEAAPDAVIAVDEAGIVTAWNPAAERIFGWTAAEALGHPLPHVSGEAEAEYVRLRERLLRDGETVSGVELVRRRRDGSPVSVRVSTAPVRDAAGRIRGAMSISGDVSERRRADEARRQLAAIVESSEDAILSQALDGTVLSWNRAAERIYGYSAAEMVGRPISRLIPPELEGEEAGRVFRLARGERIHGHETVRLRKDGVRIPVSLTVSPVRDAAGEIVSASIIARDITEAKRAEAELNRSMEHLRAVVDTQQEIATAGLDLEQVMHRIVERAQSLTAADGAVVEMVDGEEMVYAAAGGIVAGHRGARLRVDASLSGRCVTTGEILRCVDAEEDPRVDGEACRRIGIRSMLVMPLLGQEAPLGVLKVVSGRPDAFDEPAVHTLALLSQLLGAAIRDSLAYQNEQALNREIREAKEAAEAASRSKSEFLSGMSHELRTPLNSVIGFTNVLLRNRAGNLSEQDLTYLERIQANGLHLLGLINDVLDLSKIEAGKAKVELAPVTVDALVRETLDELQGSAPRGVELRLEMPVGLAPLETDERKLKQILINLIGNALKFTEAGSVTVAVHADPATRRATRIEVADTGVGIPPDRLEAIFEAFEQGEAGTARRFGGTGLGLAICASLAALLGYRITVGSRWGEGSAFAVWLDAPAGRPAAADPLLPAPAPAGPGGEPVSREFAGRLVLVIDDEADARFVLSEAIGEHGCEILGAASGEQGIDLARQVRPDLITLDLLMPGGMSGWDTYRALQADPGLRDIPVVVVSVVAEEVPEPGMEAVEHLRKPPARQDLLRVLRRTLGEHPFPARAG